MVSVSNRDIVSILPVEEGGTENLNRELTVPSVVIVGDTWVVVVCVSCFSFLILFFCDRRS